MADTSGNGNSPNRQRVSIVGLVVAVSVFIILAFAIANNPAGQQRAAQTPADKKPSAADVKPATRQARDIKENARNLIVENKETPAQEKSEEELPAVIVAENPPQPERPAVQPAQPAPPAARTAAPEKKPPQAKPKTAADAAKTKHKTEVKEVKKSGDTVKKVTQPPPPVANDNAPEWYTVKLKPVSSKNLADALATGLRARGFVSSSPVDNGNGTYSVKVAGFAYRNAAEKTKQQLNDIGFTDAQIEEKTTAH